MKKKFFTLITTICTVIACALIAVASVLLITSFTPPPQKTAVAAENFEIATLNGVYDVNYNSGLMRVGFKTTVNSGSSDWSYTVDSSYVQVCTADGTLIDTAQVHIYDDYIFISINNGVEPEVGTVYTIKKGFPFRANTGVTYEAKTDIAFEYSTKGATLTPTVSWLERPYEQETLYAADTTPTSGLPTSVTRTWELWDLYLGEQYTSGITLNCYSRETGIATVSSDGLNVTITAVAVGETTVHVNYRHIHMDVTVIVKAPPLEITQVQYLSDYDYGKCLLVQLNVDSGVYDDDFDETKRSYIRYTDANGNSVLGTVEYWGLSIAINRGERAAEVGDILTIKQGITWGQHGSALSADVSYRCVSVDGVWEKFENTLHVRDITLSESGSLGWGYMVRFMDENGNDVSSGITDNPHAVIDGGLNFFEIYNSSGENIVGEFNWLYFKDYVFGVLKDQTVGEYEVGTTLTFNSGFVFFGYEIKADIKYVYTADFKQLVLYDEGTHKPTSVSVSGADDKHDLYLNAKENTVQLSATYAPSTAATKVKYVSDNSSVATVDSNGLVTGVGKGTANITVKAGTVSTTYTVTVAHSVIIKSMTASAASAITVSYKLYFSDGFTPSASTTVIGRVHDKTEERSITSLERNGEYYVFSIPVAPAEITCPITIQLKDSDGTGNTANGKTLNDYLKHLESSSDAELASMATALRGYGAAAQTLFNVNTDVMAIDLSSLSLPSSIASTAEKSGSCYGFEVTEVDLLANADTTLRVYISASEAIENYTIILSYVDDTGGTRRFDMTNEVENGSYFDIPRIAGALLDRVYTITVTKNGDENAESNTLTASFSAIDYMSALLADGTAAQQNFAKAMYAYAQAASAFFNV